MKNGVLFFEISSLVPGILKFFFLKTDVVIGFKGRQITKCRTETEAQSVAMVTSYSAPSCTFLKGYNDIADIISEI